MSLVGSGKQANSSGRPEAGPLCNPLLPTCCVGLHGLPVSRRVPPHLPGQHGSPAGGPQEVVGSEHSTSWQVTPSCLVGFPSHPRYAGARPTLLPDVKSVVALIDTYRAGSSSWEEFENGIQAAHVNRKGAPGPRTRRPDKPKSEDYFYEVTQRLRKWGVCVAHCSACCAEPRGVRLWHEVIPDGARRIIHLRYSSLPFGET